MRRFEKLLLGAALALAAALGVGLWLLSNETNVDRSEADYRARMRPIWSGSVPGEPDTEACSAHPRAGTWPRCSPRKPV
jgi:hypothetical protein